MIRAFIAPGIKQCVFVQGGKCVFPAWKLELCFSFITEAICISDIDRSRDHISHGKVSQVCESELQWLPDSLVILRGKYVWSATSSHHCQNYNANHVIHCHFNSFQVPVLPRCHPNCVSYSGNQKYTLDKLKWICFVAPPGLVNSGLSSLDLLVNAFICQSRQ